MKAHYLLYNVSIDGNHKLVDFCIIIHGFVGCRSRIILHMKANIDNRSTTVASTLLDISTVNGGIFPKVLQIDDGVENKAI